MDDKATSDLNNELMSDGSLDSYLNDNKPSFFNLSVTQLSTNAAKSSRLHIERR